MTNDQLDAYDAPDPVEDVPEWNPLGEAPTVRIPLKVSGGRAAILCRRWAGRERLAYEDALTERMMQTDTAGEQTVKIGTFRLFAVTLTLRGSEGFPPAADGRVMFTGTREQREADLLSITDEATFAEIRDEALRVQPLPTAAADEDADEDGDGEDPSRTPRTQQTPTAGVDVTA